MRTRTAVVGWSRTRVGLRPDDLVLDVGCGAFPNEAASISCDRSLDEDRHRTGRRTEVDRPFVLCDATALPFRDGSVGFVIASHIGEHVDDPALLCSELSRVAVAGYIETPSPLADYLLDEEYHQWRVGGGGSSIHFSRKPAKRRLAKWLTYQFYRCFYAGREMGAPTYPLPSGLAGKVVAKVLYVVRGVLNRTGVMHTRVQFGPEAPLRWIVDEKETALVGAQIVTVVERGPSSGFLAGDRQAIESVAQTITVSYPGWPSPRFLTALWSAVGSSDAVYTFFAAEHALFAVAVARIRRRRFVVSVGGYDVANVAEHGYGLPSRWPHRLIPKLVLRLSDQVLSMSEASLPQAIAAGSPPERTEVLRLGVDDGWVASPHDSERDASQVVTVGYVDSVSWSRKGFDRFVEVARRDPERHFVHAGRISDEIMETKLSDVPSNLELREFITDEELRRLLWSSGIYAQLSWHEGFGVSMVEAMLAGCRPVVSDIDALSEIAGPWAVVSLTRDDDNDALARATDSLVDREGIVEWARSIASMDDRAKGLDAALFPRA